MRLTRRNTGWLIIVFAIVTLAMSLPANAQDEASASATDEAATPRVAVAGPKAEEHERPKRRQYYWLLKNLEWEKVGYVSTEGSIEDWRQLLDEADVLLIDDHFATPDADLNAIGALVRRFLDRGGLVVATSKHAPALPNAIGFDGGRLSVERPSHAREYDVVHLARWDRRHPLLCDPLPVSGKLYEPGYFPEHVNMFGFTNVSDAWNKFAWNEYDQPVFIERQVGDGLLLLTSYPMWSKLLYEVTDWQPMMRNAWALVQAQRAGKSRASDVDRGRWQRLFTDTGAFRNTSGRPFFPLMASHVVSGVRHPFASDVPEDVLAQAKPWRDQIRDIKDNGYNTMVYSYQWVKDVELKEVLDFAHEQGIQVVVPPRVGRSGWKQRVESVLSPHPAVFGWTMVDEPELRHSPPPIHIERYEIMKQVDASRPMLINLAARMFADYQPAADWMSIDNYPIPHGVPSDFGRTIARLRENTHNQVPLSAYVQAFSVSGRLPTFEEFRFMFYHGIVEGCRGMNAYAYFIPAAKGYDPFMINNDIWDAVGTVHSEIAELEDLLVGHRIMGERVRYYLTHTSSTLQNILFTDGERWVYIVVNPSDEPVKAQFFDHVGLGAEGKRLAGEPLKLSKSELSATSWEDSFTPWGVHVYTWE